MAASEKRSAGRGAGRRGFGLGSALLAAPATAALGWIGYSMLFIPHRVRLPHAVPGTRREFDSEVGGLSYYAAGPATADERAPPLLLIHSVNAAGSAYDVRPLYERYSAERPVYALDLPGFGFSERSDREYTPRLMTDAIHAMVAQIKRIHGATAVDALALSLSSEFLARAAVERPEAFHSIAIVSPTGFEGAGPRNGPPESTRGSPLLLDAVSAPMWGRPLFDLLTTRVSIRFFLQKAWGSTRIDERLLDYDYLTTHQPGAEHAPFYFVAGFLFSNDIVRLYEELRLPVFMAHGQRGDFTDYGQAEAFENRPNWSIVPFRTGAFPQFEALDAFAQSYDAFLDRVAGERAALLETNSAK
jgi:pimeloyl-ACP methyl ester carboxylesterase